MRRNAKTRRGETRTSSSRQLPDAVYAHAHELIHTHTFTREAWSERIRPPPPAASIYNTHTHILLRARALLVAPRSIGATGAPRRVRRSPVVARFPISLHRTRSRPARYRQTGRDVI